MICPDDNALAELSQGLLHADARRQAEEHVDNCPACRQLIAELARLSVVERRSKTADGDACTDDSNGRADLAPGMQVARYTLMYRIGAGGMGVVYAALDPDLDRTVAIKLQSGPDRTIAARARLRKEAKAMAKLSHPNVAAVYEVGSWQGWDFVVMEYVDGNDVAKWLAQTPRSWRDVLDVFVAGGRGVAAAHEAGIVHRDIKPSNLLLGRDGRVRVTDFGLALASKLPPPTSALSGIAANANHTDHIVGTPAYMAPEQYLGNPTDARADQFSFCVSLYEGLYAARPFAGDTIAELAQAIAADAIGIPESDDRVPVSIRAALVRGLRSDPAERFASMNDLLDALTAANTHRRSRGPMIAVALVATAVAAIGLWIGREDGRRDVATTDAGATEVTAVTEVAFTDARTHVVVAANLSPDAAPRRPTSASSRPTRYLPAKPNKRPLGAKPSSRPQVAPAPSVPRTGVSPLVATYRAREAIKRRMKTDLMKMDPAIVGVRVGPGSERKPCYTWSPVVRLKRRTSVSKQKQLAKKIVAYVVRVQNCMPPPRKRRPGLPPFSSGRPASFDGQDGWRPEIGYVAYRFPGGAVSLWSHDVDETGEVSRRCCTRSEPFGTIRNLRFTARD